MTRKLKVYKIGDLFYGKSQPEIHLKGKCLRSAPAKHNLGYVRGCICPMDSFD